MHVPYTLNTLRIYTYCNLCLKRNLHFFKSFPSRFILFRLFHISCNMEEIKYRALIPHLLTGKVFVG